MADISQVQFSFLVLSQALLMTQAGYKVHRYNLIYHYTNKRLGIRCMTRKTIFSFYHFNKDLYAKVKQAKKAQT